MAAPAPYPEAEPTTISRTGTQPDAGSQAVKRYRVTIDGRIYDVEIDDPRARPMTARLSGTAY